MARIVKAAQAFHWFGISYAAGDVVDTTGLDDRSMARLLRTQPVYVVDESDPVAVADVTAETARAEAAEVGKENVVVHGSVAGTARPSGATVVHWIGSVAPTNKATNDEWSDTAAKLLKRWDGSSWVAYGSGTYASRSIARQVAPKAPVQLLPTGVKMRLMNICYKPSDLQQGQAAGRVHGWAEMWGPNWDFTGWMQLQVDKAKAIGANAIRVQGNIGGIKRGQVTLAQYLANWKQLADYVAAQGMWFYPAGGSFVDFGGASQAEAITYLSAWAALLDGYTNVPGLDVLQEAVGSGSSNGLGTAAAVATYCSPVAAALRSSTTLPLTFSHPSITASDNSFWSDSSTRALFAGFCDYWDYHAYYDAVASDATPFFQDTANLKPLIIGEFGQTWTAGSAARTTRYTGLRGIAERPDVLGVGAWTLLDQDVNWSNNWGVSSFPGENWLNRDLAYGEPTTGTWTSDSPARCTVSAYTAAPIQGTQSIAFTATAANVGGAGIRAMISSSATASSVGVAAAGQVWSATAQVAQTVGSATLTFLRMRFYDSGGTQLSSTDGSSVTASTNPASPTTISVSNVTAPANAKYIVLYVCWGSSTNAIGDQLIADNLTLTTTSWIDRPEMIAPWQQMPTVAPRPHRVTLAPSADQTLSGGTGVWVTSTATGTYTFGVPVRAKINLVMDAQVNTASDAITGRVRLDSAAVDSRTAKFVGSAAGQEGTVQQQWTTYLTPNVSHTIDAQFSVTGTGATDKVFAANTQIVIDFEPC